MPRGLRAQENPKFRGAVLESLEAAALETISVKLQDQIYPISVADTFDPHLRNCHCTEKVDAGSSISHVCFGFNRSPFGDFFGPMDLTVGKRGCIN